MAPKLYVVTDGGVYRLPLDIEKLRNGGQIPPRPNVAPPVKFEKLECGIETPCFLHPITIMSDLVLTGGWWDYPSATDAVPNYDLSFHIRDKYLVPVPSPFTLCGPIRDMFGNLGKTSPGVYMHQFKSLICGLDATDPEKPIFDMIDLSAPPNQTPLLDMPRDIRVLNYTGWGHKFHIITSLPDSFFSRQRMFRNPNSRPSINQFSLPLGYTFDLLEKRWVKGPHQFRAAVEYEGFLIGLIPTGKLVCCPMDSYGNPDEFKPSRVLHDMFDICMLRHMYLFDADFVCMGSYKDGEDDYIWLVYNPQSPEMDFINQMPLVLFRVFIENGVICTVVEASHHYRFPNDCFFCSAFVYDESIRWMHSED